MHAAGLAGSLGRSSAGRGRAGVSVRRRPPDVLVLDRRGVSDRNTGSRSARGAPLIFKAARRRNATTILPGSPPAWGRAIVGGAVRSGLASARRGCVAGEFGTLHCHAGELRRNEPRGLVSRSANDPRPAGAVIHVRRRACRSLLSASRHAAGVMNVPALGIIPARCGRLLRTGGEGRTQGRGPVAAATSDKGRRPAPLENANGRAATACPPDSAAHPSRRRRCREAGNRAMSLPGARNRGYRAAEPVPGGGKAPAASKMRVTSTTCAAVRAARSRSVRVGITRDSCRYRA